MKEVEKYLAIWENAEEYGFNVVFHEGKSIKEVVDNINWFEMEHYCDYGFDTDGDMKVYRKFTDGTMEEVSKREYRL